MTQAQSYEAWRITYQSDEQAARSAFDTAEMLRQELLVARAAITSLERDVSQALTERDDATDFIDKILDEVLGQDRHEWTSAYDWDDALADVEAKMAALKSGKCLHQIAEPVASIEMLMSKAQEFASTWAVVDGPFDDGSAMQRANESKAELETLARALLAAAPQAVQPAVPDGFALVPLRITRAMEAVTEQEGWTWEDLLAAAESITEQQYAAPAHPAEGVPAQVMQEELAQLGYQFKDGRMIPPEHVGELLAVVQDAPCGCQFGTCETKVDSRCRMKSEIAATQPAAQPVATITGLDEFGPCFGWHEHWAKFPVGTNFYTQPAAQGLDADSAIRHLAIGRAIERVCVELPDGAEISISLEKGAGTVTLIDGNGDEQENFPTDDGFAGTLNAALDTAIADEAAQQPQEPA